MTQATDREVLGRDEELVRLRSFLDRAALRSASLVLGGGAGIGKTELWRSTVAAARARSYRVLEARPSEAERELAFAGLADLFSGLGDELATLPPPQRRPLSVALLLEEDGGSAPDARAIAVAVLALVRALAAATPLLVAVDDVQWLDRASAAALEFTLRRAGVAPVGALLACRTGEDAALELDPATDVERIDVGPLSLGATRRMLGGQLGAQFSRTTLRRVHDRANGNPFFALELARALQARGTDVPPGEELPVPDDLLRLVRDRLSALPSETGERLAAVAALGEPRVSLVAGDSLLDPAFAAGVVVVEGDRVRFTHPLLAGAAYDALPLGRRRLLHAELADVVEGSEQRARHLALAADGPDAKVATLLDAAAEEAVARGALEAAVDLSERALSLDDGSDPGAFAARVASCAQYQIRSGDFPRARGLLREALAAIPSGPPRARLLRVLAHAADGVDTAQSLLEQALAEAGGDDRLEAEIHVELGEAVLSTRRVADAVTHGRAALEAAERIGDGLLVASSLSVIAAIDFFNGRGLDRDLMERALSLEVQCDSMPIGARPLTKFGLIAKWAGDVDRSRELLYEACRIGNERGDTGVYEPLYYTCFLELLLGDWQRGLGVGDSICELGAELERDEVTLHGQIARATLLAHLGKEIEARRALETAIALGGRIGSNHGVKTAGHALATLELSLDRPAEALALARAATDADLADGVEEPALMLSFPSHAEAAIAVGELAEAEELIDWIDARAVRLDRETALAAVARCRALLAAARGDEAEALAEFARALAEHDRVQYRQFDRARTLLAQGETLRRFRRKRPAREAIEAATAIFDELGAALWSAKARAELARISGRRSADGLTETERRVAELVTEGMSTKQVAAVLVVSPKTVEGHLTRIYAKLDVHSRAQLARRLA